MADNSSKGCCSKKRNNIVGAVIVSVVTILALLVVMYCCDNIKHTNDTTTPMTTGVTTPSANIEEEDLHPLLQRVLQRDASSSTTTTNRCTDLSTTWHDSGGAAYTCSWYASYPNACSQWGGGYRNMGHTANTACCTCGGGNFIQISQRARGTNGGGDGSSTSSSAANLNCIDVRKADSSNGTPLWLWPCNGSPAQLFKMDSKTNYIRSGLDYYKCIVGEDLEAEQSTDLMIYDCPDSPYKGSSNKKDDTSYDDDDLEDEFRWRYDPGSQRIWNIDNPYQCIDAANDEFVDGIDLPNARAIHLWNCHSGDNQKWLWKK